jgi:hypothetical protein
MQKLSGTSSLDITPPLPLSVTIEPQLYPAGLPGQQLKEKNWMPFAEGDRMFVVHSVHPTRVFEMDMSSGKSTAGYTTSAEALFNASGLPAERLHGGPPLALITISQSVQNWLRVHTTNPGRARRYKYYLGALHYYDLDLTNLVYTYHHYFFVMQPRPPFRICTVSREIPLQPVPEATEQKRNVQYISGLQYDRQNGTVMVSYGAADSQSRLLIMSLPEIEVLFKGQADRCWRQCNRQLDPAGCRYNI